jgi:hypothetical protein
MTNKPRIAFCFSWQARTLDQTYLFFHKNLFDTAKEQWFEYDIFCAVEDDEDVDKVNLLNPTKIEKSTHSDVEKLIVDTWWADYDMKILESYPYYYWDLLHNDIFYIRNQFQQFYKVSKSIEMMDNYWTNYDLVVKLRFDCFFFKKINYSKILKKTNKWVVLCNNFVTCGDELSKYTVINDFFFFWSQKSMKLLKDLFYNFKDWLLWDEVKWFSKYLYKFFISYKKFAYYINNKVIKRWVVPVYPIWLIERQLYKIWSTELVYYNYFLKKWIKVLKDNFSFILLRKNTEESIIILEKSNEYEI